MLYHDTPKPLLAAARRRCLETTVTGKACRGASPEHSLQAAGAQGFRWVEVLPLCLTDTKFGVYFFYWLDPIQ